MRAVQVDREQLAWAAGFFDGEGNTCCTKGGVRVQVWQCDREPLDRFHSIVGLGKMMGPYTSHHRSFEQSDGLSRRGMYCYQIGGFERTQQLVATLWPWLTTIKRAQAAKHLAKFKSQWKPLGHAWLGKKHKPETIVKLKAAALAREAHKRINFINAIATLNIRLVGEGYVCHAK